MKAATAAAKPNWKDKFNKKGIRANSTARHLILLSLLHTNTLNQSPSLPLSADLYVSLSSTRARTHSLFLSSSPSLSLSDTLTLSLYYAVLASSNPATTQEESESESHSDDDPPPKKKGSAAAGAGAGKTEVKGRDGMSCHVCDEVG